MESVLSVQNVTKCYKRNVPILRDFNFELAPGRVFGLLGPNGCGKTTLLKLIAGVLTPNSGEIFVRGQSDAVARASLISFLPERAAYNPGQRVSDVLDFYADFFADFDRGVAEGMLRDLAVEISAPLRTLSKGTKEKVQLVLTMSRRAALYLLDEPIGGVDPAARDYVLSTILGRYNKEGAVIVTTHLIHDVETALDEFAFLSPSGQILCRGMAEETRQEKGKTLDEYFREVFRYAP